MKKLVVVTLFILTLTLAACIGQTSGYSNDIGLNVWVDPETGVNYYVYAHGYQYGITPRYHTDGSLYISDRWKDDIERK